MRVYVGAGKRVSMAGPQGDKGPAADVLVRVRFIPVIGTNVEKVPSQLLKSGFHPVVILPKHYRHGRHWRSNGKYRNIAEERRFSFPFSFRSDNVMVFSRGRSCPEELPWPQELRCSVGSRLEGGDGVGAVF